jgi:hypothetical protein
MADRSDAVIVRQRTEHHPGVAFHRLQANVVQQGLRDEQASGLVYGLGYSLKCRMGHDETPE